MNIILTDKISIFSSNGALIRFMLALLVLLHHSFVLSQNVYDPIYEISNGQLAFGGIAVCGFFFFSGLYVTKSMHKTSSCWKFFINRVKRIFPALIIVVLCCVFILGPILSTYSFIEYISSSETYVYLMNMLLVPVHNLPGVFEQNIYGQTVNGALWTMPVEFLCYIALIVIMFAQKHIIKSEKFFKVMDIIALCSSIVLYCLCIYLNLELLIAAFRAVSCFFIGAVFFDFKDNIKLNWKFGVPSVVLFIVCLFTPVANFAVLVFLPYVLVYLSLGIKQINCKWKILSMSYEIYLVGFPIQQTLVAIWGGQMPIWLNACLAIPIIIALMYSVIFIKWVIKRK